MIKAGPPRGRKSRGVRGALGDDGGDGVPDLVAGEEDEQHGGHGDSTGRQHSGSAGEQEAGHGDEQADEQEDLAPAGIGVPGPPDAASGGQENSRTGEGPRVTGGLNRRLRLGAHRVCLTNHDSHSGASPTSCHAAGRACDHAEIRLKVVARTPCQDVGVEELNAESAISAGGWDGRYAVTLAVATRGGIAAALIDTNGDGADIDLDEYERGTDGHWHELGSGSAGDSGASRSPRLAATWGCSDPGAHVEIEYLGHSYTVMAPPSGWWLFIGPATDDSDAIPRRIGRI
jgi:hypothetical protein